MSGCVRALRNMLLESKPACKLKLSTCVSSHMCEWVTNSVAAVCVKQHPSITLTGWASTCQGPFTLQTHTHTHAHTEREREGVSFGDNVRASVYSLVHVQNLECIT